MKTKMKLLPLALLALSSGAMAQTNPVTVKANIKGLEAGKWVYYRELGGDKKKDSVQSIAGGFNFRMDIPEGSGNQYLISIGKNYNEPGAATVVYLDKGTLSITGKGPGFTDAKYTGSKGQDDNMAYDKFIKDAPELKHADSIYKKGNELYAKGDTAALKAMEPMFDQLRKARTDLTKQWISKHAGSVTSTIQLAQIRYDMDNSELENIFNTLSAAAKNNVPGKGIAHAIEVGKLTAVGKPAMEFTQNDTLGKPVSLKDFRGKYLLLDFWASWCKPCRAENPNVVAAFNKYKDKNFTVLSVSLDQPEGKEKWLAAIHKDGLTWTHVSDLNFWDNAVAKQYNVQSIPANFLLDPNGNIIAKDLHGDELDNKLAELLK